MGCEKPPAAKTPPQTIESGDGESASGDDEAKSPGTNSDSLASLSPSTIAKHNRGVGLMGKFDYSAAHNVFEELVNDHPTWTDAKVDLAIAKLNRRLPDDVNESKRLLDVAVGDDDSNLRAKYCRALLHLYEAEPEAATRLFKATADGDPRDAYAVYYTGQCLFEDGELKEALEQFEQAQSLDPYLRSAYYGAFQVNQRLKENEEAKENLRVFQKLQDNPQSRLAEMKYSRMGPKASVSTLKLPGTQPIPKPNGPIFQPPVSTEVSGDEEWPAFDGPENSSSITFCDINGDGQLDWFFAGGSGSKTRIVLDGETLTIAADHPLANIPDVNAALWGDFDNDGLVDVYFCRSGTNLLWRQSAANEWEDVTKDSKTDNGDCDSVDGAFFDADHDGDLDLFIVNQDAPNELLSNNATGTFRSLGESQGIAGDGNASAGVVIGDFDGDRDADIMVVNENSPHEVYLNNRLWDYQPASGFEALCKSKIATAIAADLDADGQVEIITLGENTITRWSPDENNQWQGKPLASSSNVSAGSGSQIAAQDIDGNGKLDLVINYSEGWSVLNAENGQPLFESKWENDAASLSLLASGTTGLSIIAPQCGKAPQLWSPGEGRYPFALVQFTGKENKADAMRSNRSGIGINAAVRMGTEWTTLQTFRDISGPGQSRQPVAVGLGKAESADFLSLLWPDGLFQTELDIAAGKTHTIEETQRQVSSCPVLFAWNGTEFAFISDILGVGGQGFNLTNGNYASPRPWERTPLPDGCLAERNGEFVLKVGEPMEESCYLDALRLVSYDLPPGWNMVNDDRQATGDPPPTGEPLFFRQEFLPIKAENATGQDILNRITIADRIPADPGKNDHRFLGLMSAPHSVTIAFEKPIQQLVGENCVALMIDGWIEYPYSQTMFAAWQADATYDAPRLEARSADGEWQTVYDGFGYPAGMPRKMALPLDLSLLPQGTTEFRLTSNMQIYWDRIALIAVEPCLQATRQTMRLVSATLSEVGFPKRTYENYRNPKFDYNNRSPLWDTRHQPGFYSNFGNVLPLVEQHDDAVAIMGPGEEVEFHFTSSESEVQASWTRKYVLESHGWCKDMDLYTKNGESLAPLPRSKTDPTDEEETQRKSLHEQFNTRFKSG